MHAISLLIKGNVAFSLIRYLEEKQKDKKKFRCTSEKLKVVLKNLKK